MTKAPLRLLLVEDDPRVGSFIAHGLRDEGFDVEWATTGEDAQAKIGDDVDLVLLDHMLPRKSGIDIARSFRADGRTVPILMLTARDAPEDQRAAFAAGANAFMSKPFLFDDLVAEIRRLLPNAA
ncbi:MAG TPA: response regulator [Gemmatimonadales bacterium]|jgi:DNA-binding response OmpR family regulator